MPGGHAARQRRLHGRGDGRGVPGRLRDGARAGCSRAHPARCVVGVVLAAVPVGPLVACYLWLDRYEPEPRRLLALGLLLGRVRGHRGRAAARRASAASSSASPTHRPRDRRAGDGGGQQGAVHPPAAVVAARASSTASSTASCTPAWSASASRSPRTSSTSPAAYNGSDGVGPAASDALTGTVRGPLPVQPVRAPALHRVHRHRRRHRRDRRAAGPAGRSPRCRVSRSPSCAHAVWNTSAVYGGGRRSCSTYVLLMVPAFLLLVGFAVWARRSEGRMLTAALERRGRPRAIPATDIAWLVGLPPGARSRAHRARAAAARRPSEAMRRLPAGRRSSSASCTTATCAAPRRRTSPRAGTAYVARIGGTCGPTIAVPAPRRQRGTHPMTPVGDGPRSRPAARRRSQMLTALVRLREALQPAALPLELPGVEEQRAAAREMVDQLEDYVLPRLMPIDAPLLAVVGGSTGAGKSTLVNSLVGRRVTEPGVLRPTTRSPVLVHHPADAELVRQGPASCPTSSAPPAPPPTPARSSWWPPRRVPAGPGDPRRPRHRLGGGAQPDPGRPAARGRRPVAVRDLRRALRRPGAVGLPARRPPSAATAVAIVLDRTPPDAVAEVEQPPGPDAGQPRASGTRRCSRSPRARSTTDGLLAAERGRRDPRLAGRRWPPTPTPGPRWSSRPSTVRSARSPPQPHDGRRRGGRAGRDGAPAARGRGRGVRPRPSRAVDEASADGTLLRGEVLARWQEFVGTGELLQSPGEPRWAGSATGSSTRCKGKPQQAERVTVAVESGLRDADPRARRGRRRAGRRVLAVAGRPGSTCSPTPAEDLGRASRDFRAPGRARGARLAAGRAGDGAHRGRRQALHRPVPRLRRQRAVAWR